VHDENYLG